MSNISNIFSKQQHGVKQKNQKKHTKQTNKQKKKKTEKEIKKTDLTYLEIGHVSTTKNNFYY